MHFCPHLGGIELVYYEGLKHQRIALPIKWLAMDDYNFLMMFPQLWNVLELTRISSQSIY